MKPCKNCAEPIPKQADFCNHCKTYQDWRRFFAFPGTILPQLAALVPVVTAVVGVFFYVHNCTGNSYTTASIMTPTAETISVLLSNSGPKRSMLRGAVLELGELSMENVTLKISDTTPNVISDRGQAKIELRVLGLAKKRGETISKTEILSRLDTRTATLSLDIEESNDPHHVIPIPFKAEMIRELVKQQLPNDPTY
jgi:hypothetical protein